MGLSGARTLSGMGARGWAVTMTVLMLGACAVACGGILLDIPAVTWIAPLIAVGSFLSLGPLMGHLLADENGPQTFSLLRWLRD